MGDPRGHKQVKLANDPRECRGVSHRHQSTAFSIGLITFYLQIRRL